MSEKIMELITWLGALGIPSIFAMTVWCIRCCLQYTRQLKVLAKAQQAQMRSQLLEQYHFYMDDGWISEDPMVDYAAYFLNDRENPYWLSGDSYKENNWSIFQ